MPFGFPWHLFALRGPTRPTPILPVEHGLALEALDVAKEEIGRGEAGGNNLGEAVITYRRGANDGAPWCAAFCAWCFEEAAKNLDRELNFKRSHGAKRLWARICKAGARVEEPAPGDVVLWHRGRGDRPRRDCLAC
jgi:hypothetical protein